MGAHHQISINDIILFFIMQSPEKRERTQPGNHSYWISALFQHHFSENSCRKLTVKGVQFNNLIYSIFMAKFEKSWTICNVCSLCHLMESLSSWPNKVCSKHLHRGSLSLLISLHLAKLDIMDISFYCWGNRLVSWSLLHRFDFDPSTWNKCTVASEF